MIHRLERRLILPLPRSEVFPFFADARNLERITPSELRFRITSALPIAMREDARIDYQLRLFGVPFAWRTRISRWQPNEGFTDEQIRGPFARWVHRHDFRDAPSGAPGATPDDSGTEIVDRVEYALPLAPVGALVHPIVRWQLDRIFDHRQQATQRIFGEARTGGGERAA